MRWDELTVEQDERTRLPGLRDPAVVRRFDAPEALDTRFYEVRAKSVLNRVPERSSMPFRWTINPYRGCAHACVYCQEPDTSILLADGRTSRIADLRIGDAIVGTHRVGSYRRFVETQVLDVWRTLRPAWRVVLEDGTELVSSANHRYLTDRGWKYVAPAADGQRPHLTTHNEMLGIGRFRPSPGHFADYRQGYLCGMIRGDGHVGRHRGTRGETLHRFRLALADSEALDRSERFLDRLGVPTVRYVHKGGTSAHRRMEAVRAQSRAAVEAIEEEIDWPLEPSDDWAKGFLAGIFDAEGGTASGSLRIHNTDDRLIDYTASCLRYFDFDVVVEPPTANGCRAVRIRGGLPERMRFFALTDPAITRKRTIVGAALKTNARTRVVSIESLGRRRELVDITTGTGDFIANGVVSHNCFARPTHAFLGFDAGRDFEREIVVKVNAPEVVARELRRPSWRREHVTLGTNTDPYQWVESKYRLLPDIWRALRDSRTPSSILTKSPLVLRDLDVLRSFVDEGVPITANLSIPTLDRAAWRATEPRTPNPHARIEAVKALNEAGIPTGVLVAPLQPGINDDPAQVRAVLEACAEAGATGVGGAPLHLRGEVRDVFLGWLREHRPDLVDRYEELYARGAYLPEGERVRLTRLLDDPAGPGFRPFPRRTGAGGPVANGEPAGPSSPRGDRGGPRGGEVRGVTRPREVAPTLF